MRAIRRDPAGAGLALAAALVLGLTILYPLASVLREAVIGEHGFDPAPVLRIVSSPVPRAVVANTLIMGLMAGPAVSL